MPLLLPKLDGSTIRLFSYPRKRPTLEAPPTQSVAESQAYAPTSSFDRLPVELQVEIFAHCLPSFPRFDNNEGPLLIGRVCSAWRTVLLSTPRFWSSFEIEVTGSGPSISLQDIRIVSTMELWLQRSRSYPLSVRLIHIPVGRVPDPRSAQLLALLIPEARRWRHVQFIIPAINMASLRQSFPSEFPSLRSLTLQMKGLWTSEPSISLSTAGIPWRQLTYLDLQLEQDHLPTLGDCLAILGQMNQVKECILRANSTLDPSHGVSTHVTSLESFHLILHDGGDSPVSSLSRFLHHLSLPSLKSLDLNWIIQGNRSWSSAQHDFLSFLQNISSTLRILKLSYLPLSEDDLMACLLRVPLVENLDLRFALIDTEHEPITDNIMTALALPPPMAVESTNRQASPDIPLLPCLTSLNLECNGSRLSFIALLLMINSRRHHSDSPFSTLQHVRVRSMKPVVGEVERQVGLLIEKGMDIFIDTLPLL